MIILGSGSPRRKEILSFFSLPFKQISSSFDERSILYEGNPIEYVTRLAVEKARALVPSYPDQIILTADTIVVHENRIFNKPTSREERKEMLDKLNGNWHCVITALCCCRNSEEITVYDQTDVLFNSLSERELEKYIEGFEGMDKAAGYGIQQGGCSVVKRMEGCFYNVMGLPINSLKKALAAFDIDLFDHFKKVEK
jgi:septum formation protein